MEKSPIWKHFAKRETGMVCSVCGMILTSGSGRFLAANLEKHLRTMHAQSEAFASFQREKTEWTTRRPRQSVAHKIALPVERKPRTVITSEEERRDRRRKMCREAQRRHRQRLRMLRETHESIGPSNAEKDNPLTPDCIPDLAPAGDGIHVETNGGAASATVDDAHGSETCKNALDPKVCRAEHKSNPSDSTETTCSTNAVVSFNNTVSTDLSTINLRLSLVNGSANLHGSDCSPFISNEKVRTPFGLASDPEHLTSRNYPTESVANSSSTLTTPEGPSFNDHYSVVGRVGRGLAMCESLPLGADAHSMVSVSKSQQPAGLHPTLCLPVWNLFNFGYLPAGAVGDGPGTSRAILLKNHVEGGRGIPGHYSDGLLLGQRYVQQSSNCDKSPTTGKAVGKLKNFNIESLLS